ncbi:MFS transporter [Alicyclobacillus shizuokensis]|uniref:MFS transporter n=1 Tax=Alicyclobacillus shizuokensis TaxID=392014 RepID=UPI000833CE7F|nr:MFS transporter [Alicyclobacillus shizuokensis]
MAKTNQGFGIVALMCLGIFVCMIDTTIMNIALPAIQDDLHASLEAMSWMLNVYTMSIAVLSIPLARVAEIFGKNKFFILGTFLFGTGSALCGLANSGEWLITARFVQSIGAAVLMPVSMIIGVSAVPVSKRYIALATLGSTQGLAAALGPAVGGFLTQIAGWPWVFYVNVPICLAAILVGLTKLPLRNEDRTRVKLDFIGVLLSSLSVFSLTFVLVRGNDWGWTSRLAWVCYLVAFLSLVAFLMAERRVANPMVNLSLFRNRQFGGATLAMVAATAYMVGVTVLLPQFLTRFQNKTELQAALLITPVSATIFFIAPISGTIANKIGNFLPVLFGFMSLGSAYFLLARLTIQASTLHLVLIAMLVGAGFGLVIGPASTASAADFEGEMLTAAQSVTQMFRQIAVVLAVAISVSGLTHYLSVQQREVMHYASDRASELNVPDSVKSAVLQESKTRILSSTWNSGGENPPPSSVLPKTERQRMIAAAVNKVLAGMPPGTRKQARSRVIEQVTQQVDADIQQYKRQMDTYSYDLEHQAAELMSASFSKLYRAGFPIVLATIMVSFLFLGGRKAEGAK